MADCKELNLGPTWWKEAVVYQIYPRSFMDSNSDGIGDLNGIILKLDYLKDLGIDVIWLSPINDSPNDDNGYDIRDYYAIMNEFGSMQDFDKLISEAHKRGIKVLMDLVVNHTSDEHAWFIESKSAKENPKRDYYIWRDGKDDSPPNNWGSFFSPSAWEYDNQTNQYYLHLFSKKQPDLNWDNKNVREEIYTMMTWWLDKGVDGFRMDVINGLQKPKGLPDSEFPPTCAEGYVLDISLYFNNPGMTDILHEMNEQVLSKYDVMTVGECTDATPDVTVEYASLKGNALNTLFHFDNVSIRDSWTVQKLRDIQAKWYRVIWNKAWNTQYLSNHDQPRQVSIFGDDDQYRIQSAKLLATMLHTLPGTPFIFQGEELGMTNNNFSNISEFKDINAHFDYDRMLAMGKTKEEAIDWLNCYSRDHARTPMQWDETLNAGFTKTEPWMQVNKNYSEINAHQQTNDPNSVFNYYKTLIALRKANPVMVYGEYNDVSPDNESIYAYTRTLVDTKWLIVLNLSSNDADCIVEGFNQKAEPMLTNYKSYDVRDKSIKCPPWFAAIFII